MRKFASLLVAAAVTALILSALAPTPAAAADGTPVDITLSLPSGGSNVASTNYVVAYAHPANSALQPVAVSYVYAGTLATNKTIILRKASGGPAWKTISHLTGGGASYSGVSFVTDTWYWRRGVDTIHVTASGTNACTVVLHCLER